MTTGGYAEITWAAFLGFVSEPTSAPKKEDLEGWSPAKFAGNTRSGANVELVSCIALDDDKSGLPIEQVVAIWSGLGGAVHTTFSSTPQHPKYRIVLRCSRDVTAAEYVRVRQYVRDHAAKCGQTLDDGAKDASRFWYVPGRAEGAPYEWRELVGEPLPVDKILAAAPAPATTDAPTATAPAPRTSSTPTDRRKAVAAALGAAWPPVGSRHEAKKALAGALYRDGVSKQDALEFVREVYAHVKSDDGGKLGNERNDVTDTYDRADTHNVTGWTTLTTLVDPVVVEMVRNALRPAAEWEASTKLKLDQVGALYEPAKPAPVASLPAFPVGELPGVLRSFVSALATFTEVPVDLPAMFALGACSAAIAGRVDLEMRAGYVEPLNLFVVVGARTGERKSPIHAACFGALMEVERFKAEAAAPLVATIKARRDALQKSMLRKQTEYANLKREDVALEHANNSIKPGGVMLEREIADLAVQIEKLKVPPTPKLLVADVTVEKLASLLGEQNGRLCVASDEGTVLSNIAGRYAKDGRSSFDVLLQGYSGTSVRVDRQSTDRPPVYVPRPRLTICLAVQPEVIERLSKDETMRSQGLLARFLYALPESMVGRRPVAGAQMPADVRVSYDAVVKALASVPTPEERGLDEIPRIRLSSEAYELHQQLQRDIEPRLEPKTGDLAEIVDWASKYAGNVARIAGVLHCVQCVQGGASGDEVNGETMRSAIRIGEYLLAHALAAYGSMGKSATEKDGEHLLRWAQKRPQSFDRRDVRRLGPGSLRGDKKRLVAALEFLVEAGLLRVDGERWAAA